MMGMGPVLRGEGGRGKGEEGDESASELEDRSPLNASVCCCCCFVIDSWN